jgi:creatinine amidohydrolase/Fe(II)-dependent formamide hydrolase-like protein
MEAAERGNVASFESIQERMMSAGIDAVTANGVLGDQRPANVERGQFYLDTLARYLASDLEPIRMSIEKGS